MEQPKIGQLKVFIISLIDSGMTQTEIGKKLGYSRSQVSKFLDGGKTSDEFLIAVEQLMKDYPEQKVVSKTKNSLEDLDFIFTKDAKNILGMCKATESINGFSAILGNAGTGKTETVKHFVKSSSNAVYIRCNCLMTTRDILKAIGKSCGTVLQANSKSEMFDELIEYLIHHPKILIFDEVDQIMPMNNINKVETIRNLHDIVKEYGNSLILVGSLAVEHHLKKRNMNENYGQIDSRIDYLYKTQGLSEAELFNILSEFNVADSAKKEIITLILRTTKGGIRWLSKVLNKCLDIVDVEDETITNDIVKSATTIMML